MSEEQKETKPREEITDDGIDADEMQQLAEIENEVEEVNRKQKELSRSFSSRRVTISPTLPPEYLEAYERICPGAGKKILLSSHELAEREQSVDLEIRKREQSRIEKDTDANSKRADRAQVLAFILSMTVILGGIFLIAIGKDTAGLGSIITSVVALVSVFIVSRFKSPKKQKSEIPDEVISAIKFLLENND
jgi:uncharacterized membrane protein